MVALLSTAGRDDDALGALVFAASRLSMAFSVSGETFCFNS